MLHVKKRVYVANASYSLEKTIFVLSLEKFTLIYILLLEKLCAGLHYRHLSFSYRFGEPCIVQQCQLTGRIKAIITNPKFLQIAELNILFSITQI